VINEVLSTNFEGITQSDIQINNEYYKFIVEYNGVVVLTTTPTYIYGTSITLKAPLSSQLDNYYSSSSITGYITKVNNQTYSFNYNDEDNTALRGCLYSYQYVNMAKVLSDSSCASASSGTVFVTIGNTSGTSYILYGVVTKSNKNITVDTEVVSLIDSIPETTSKMGIIGAFFLTIILGLLFLWNPAIAVVISSAVPLLLSVIGFIAIPVSAGIILLIVGLVVAYVVNKREA
jgi:hypothetical protein